MNKPALPPSPIDNAADYIDALTQPRAPELAIKKKIIPSRRMRDKFREEVAAVEVVKKLG